MSKRLRAYDGAVDGIDVLNGLVVLKTGTPEQADETRPAGIAKHPSSSQTLSQHSTVDRILKRATDVIGTREEAMRWLGTPIRALNYATPVSLLVDDAGTDEVLAVLVNLENGVL